MAYQTKSICNIYDNRFCTGGSLVGVILSV